MRCPRTWTPRSGSRSAGDLLGEGARCTRLCGHGPNAELTTSRITVTVRAVPRRRAQAPRVLSQQRACPGRRTAPRLEARSDEVCPRDAERRMGGPVTDTRVLTDRRHHPRGHILVRRDRSGRVRAAGNARSTASSTYTWGRPADASGLRVIGWPLRELAAGKKISGPPTRRVSVSADRPLSRGCGVRGGGAQKGGSSLVTPTGVAQGSGEPPRPVSARPSPAPVPPDPPPGPWPDRAALATVAVA